MQCYIKVISFLIPFISNAEASTNSNNFVFTGLVDNLPPDQCSGLIGTVKLPGSLSHMACGAQCLLTPGCGRYFYANVEDGHVNCTLAKQNEDWQPTTGNTHTFYSKVCNNDTAVSKPQNCKILRDAGNDCSGYYTIYPDAVTPIGVYCDMQTDQGGWTAIQRRLNSDVNFDTTWADYRDGFGRADYWLGNKWIHMMTNTVAVELYIKLEDWSCETRYARYDSFSISSEADKFRLSCSGYSGDAGDNLAYNKGQRFSTQDQDNDSHYIHCAVDLFNGGWWYNACTHSNLNGIRYLSRIRDHKSMVWYGFLTWNSLKTSIMMIRRK